MNWSQRIPQINASDLQHRLSRIIAIGTVVEADYEKARVKVTIGEWTTGWLPWLTRRASNDINWCALEVGEQVLVISPSGDMAQGVVIGSIYQQQQQDLVSDIPPEKRQSIQRIKYQDGTTIEYDRDKHLLKADVKGDVELLVEKNITAKVTKDVDITVAGKLTAKVSGNVDITVDGTLNATVAKAATIKAKGITLESTGDMTLKAAGTMKLNAAHISAQE